MKINFLKIGFAVFYIATFLGLFLACNQYNTAIEQDTIEMGQTENEKQISINSTTMQAKEKDPRLFGTWRYTEVLSSGYGGDYTSLTTDYFFQFFADGIFASWTGNSALGNSGGNSIEDLSENVVKANWYTQEGSLYFVDPANHQEAGVTYYIDKNRLMLSGNGENKILEKIN